MRGVATLEVAKRAIRGRVCTKCWVRPDGSARWGEDVVRECEGRCQIFTHLHKVLRVERLTEGASAEGIEAARKQEVCATCQEMPSSGEYCLQNLTRSCPLSRYQLEVVAAIRDARAGAASKA